MRSSGDRKTGNSLLYKKENHSEMRICKKKIRAKYFKVKKPYLDLLAVKSHAILSCIHATARGW